MRLIPDADEEFILYALKGCETIKSVLHLDRESFKERLLRRPLKPERLHWLWDYLFLHNTIKRDHIDIFHSTDLVSIPTSFTRKKIKIVCTIYDLIPFIFPDEFKKIYPLDYRLALQQGLYNLKRVDAVITISHNSKKDIQSLTGIPPEKIKVIYCGVRDEFLQVNTELNEKKKLPGHIKSRYGLYKEYILYVGGFEPRKNVINLIKGYYSLVKEYKIQCDLVLAGNGFLFSSQGEKIKDLISELRIDKRVKLLGFVPDQDIKALYQGSSLFAFLSLYEGFGLPVLEAMACSIPVVSSNRSSLPEVIGEAGILVDPENVGAISQGMYKGLVDTSLRKNLIEKGKNRVKNFSWEKAAKETLALYRSFQ